MADGGRDLGYEDPYLDNTLDDDDDDDDEQEVHRTQPFQPGASSTPYHGGEQVEMQTMHHEQSGLPDTSYQEETPFLERTPSISDLQKESSIQQKLRKTVKYLKNKIPDFNFEKNKIRRGKQGGKNEGKIVYVRPKFGEYKIMKDDESGFTKSFLDAVKKYDLGRSAEEIIAEDRDTIREQRQRKKELENELKQAEDLYPQIDEKEKEIELLQREMESTQSIIDAIHDKYGSNLEMEAELRRLEQQKKNYETDLRGKKKELASLQKKAKNIDKMQSDVVRLGSSIAEKDSKINAMQERLNQTKTLDDMKEMESEMLRQKAEDQAIIQDENASPSEKEAAQGREAERNEELPRLQAQIAEREMERPLSERVKEIFKKYGVTVTSVLLASGITIGVVVSTVTNALKASTKALGKGLKDIGAKLGSMLPGLIGSIANFLFKAAGQAIGFLAENTWLLILAVVAFLFEKNIKKRR